MSPKHVGRDSGVSETKKVRSFNHHAKLNIILRHKSE